MFYTTLDSFPLYISINVQVISIVQCCACFYFNSMTAINNMHNMLIVFWGFDYG